MSSPPTKYVRAADFSDFSALHPSDQQPGVDLDAEFDRLKVTTDGTIDRLALIQRADGALVNGIVTVDSLADTLKASMTGNALDLATALATASTNAATAAAAQTASSASQTAAAASATAAAASAVTASALNTSSIYGSAWVASVVAAPTGAEADGVRYLISHTPSGTFAGHADQVAMKASGAWIYSSPGDGQEVFVQATLTIYRFKNAAWAKSRVVIQSGDSLATAFAQTGVSAFVMMGGTYTGVNITPPSNCTISAVGQVILQTTSNVNPILDLTSKSGVLLFGNFKLQGNGTGNTGTPLAGATNSGSVGIKLYNTTGFQCSGYIEICNLGYGIDEHAPASAFSTPGLNGFRDLRVHDCFYGAFVRDFAEYSNYTNCWFYKNIAAVRDESGNRGYYNCHFVFNNWGIFLDGVVEPGNNSHGIVSGCFINHNQYNIVCDTTQLGMLFTGCQILSDQSGSGHGFINIIDGARLINFVGCDIGSDVTIDATSQANFVGNTIRSTLANAPAVTAGGVCTGTGNVDELGVQAFLWNAMGSWTPVLSFGGASVGITYSYQNARYRVADGYLEFSGQITLGSKGSSVGIAAIGGLPKAAGLVPPNTPITLIGTAMAVGVTDLRGFVGSSTSALKLFNFNAGSITQLTDTAFGGTDTIYFSGRIPLG